MNQKIINNALSAYFWMGALLLIPSKNQNISHPFVKSHAKMALFLHVLFFINYMIFIHYKLFSNITVPFIAYPLSDTLATLFFLILFWFLLFGCFKAKHHQNFWKTEMAHITSSEWLIEMKNTSLNEEGKITFVLSYFPFAWYTVATKLADFHNPVLISNVKINFLFTFINVILLVLWYGNLVSFLFLWYIIGAVFLSLYLFTQEKIFIINTSKIPTVSELYLHLKAIFKYLYTYFSKSHFVPYGEIFISEKEIEKNTKTLLKEELKDKKSGKIPFFLYYIPFVNLVWLVDLWSKYKYHVQNGLMLTIISSILWISNMNDLQIFLLFPIAYLLGSQADLSYRLVFLKDIFDGGIFLIKKVFFIGKKTRSLQDEVTQKTYNIK